MAYYAGQVRAASLIPLGPVSPPLGAITICPPQNPASWLLQVSGEEDTSPSSVQGQEVGWDPCTLETGPLCINQRPGVRAQALCDPARRFHPSARRVESKPALALFVWNFNHILLWTLELHSGVWIICFSVLGMEPGPQQARQVAMTTAQLLRTYSCHLVPRQQQRW